MQVALLSWPSVEQIGQTPHDDDNVDHNRKENHDKFQREYPANQT